MLGDEENCVDNVVTDNYCTLYMILNERTFMVSLSNILVLNNTFFIENITKKIFNYKCHKKIDIKYNKLTNLWETNNICYCNLDVEEELRKRVFKKKNIKDTLLYFINEKTTGVILKKDGSIVGRFKYEIPI